MIQSKRGAEVYSPRHIGSECRRVLSEPPRSRKTEEEEEEEQL